MSTQLSASSRIVQARLHPWRTASVFKKSEIIAVCTVVVLAGLFGLSKVPPKTTDSVLRALGLRQELLEDEAIQNDVTPPATTEQPGAEAIPDISSNPSAPAASQPELIGPPSTVTSSDDDSLPSDIPGGDPLTEDEYYTPGPGFEP